MHLNQKIITPDINIELNNDIFEAIAAFEAYLYEVERGEQSTRLQETTRCIDKTKKYLLDAGRASLASYCDALIDLIVVIEQMPVEKAADQHGVLLGGLNQLINFSQLKHYIDDDILPLSAVLDDVFVVSNKAIKIPASIGGSTKALDNLTVEDLYANGSSAYGIEQLDSMLKSSQALHASHIGKLAHFTKGLDEGVLISAGTDAGILDDLMLGMKALTSESALSGNYCPAISAALSNSLILLGEAVAVTEKKFDKLPKLIQQFRELLVLLANCGCDNQAALHLSEKYQIANSGPTYGKVRLRLGTPDQQTVVAFLTNVEADVVTLQEAIENFPQDNNWQNTASQLFEFAVNLRHAAVLAGHADIAKHFQRLGEILHQFANNSNYDQDSIETLASELVMVSERLSYHLRVENKGTNSDALTQLLVQAIDECRLALEADNLASLPQKSTEEPPVAPIEAIVDRFGHAMQAAQFLSNTQVALVIADGVCTAQSCLLSLVDNPRPLVERQLLDSFIEALAYVKQAVSESNIADENTLMTSLNEARQRLRNMQDLYSESSSLAMTAPQEVALEQIEGGVTQANEVVEAESTDAAAQDDFADLELDEEIVEIFLEEAEEVFESIDIRQAEIAEQEWEGNPTLIIEQLRELRRAYHTLKGSGRMAGATHTAEASWEVESMLNRVLDNSIDMNSQRMLLLSVGRTEIGNLLACFESRNMPDIERYDQFVAITQQFCTDEGLSAAQQQLHDFIAGSKSDADSNETAESSDTVIAEQNTDNEVNDGLPEQNVDIEADVNLSAKEESQEQPSVSEPDAFESSEMQSLEHDNLGDASEDLHDQGAADEQIVEPSAGEEQNAAVKSNANDDNVLQSIFKDEASEQLAVLLDYLNNNTAEQAQVPGIAVERALHTISGGARVTAAQQVAQLVLPAEILVGQMRLRGKITETQYLLLQQTANWLEQYLGSGFVSEAVLHSQTDELADRLNQAIEDCFSTEKTDSKAESANASSMAQALHNCKFIYQADAILCRWRVATTPPNDVAALQEELETLCSVASEYSVVVDLSKGLLALYEVFSESSLYYEAYVLARKAHIELEEMLDAMAIGVQPTASHIVADLRLLVEEQKQLIAQANESADANEKGVAESIENTADDEIVSIFLEESHELLEELDLNINRWIAMQGDATAQAEILRILHTIKGGARMAGLQQVGELCHNFEAFLQGLALDAKSIDQKVCKRVTSQLSKLVTALNNAEDSSASGAENVDSEQKDERPAEEYVRVQAAALEQLVGLAGETSISRSLIEERMSGFAYAIEEVDSTVERLNEQLRRLEIETEAQINFRKEQVEIEGLEEFDPLEMDRYSHFQQLSRSLIESASDLQALKSTLVDKTRDVETLLLQQSRINTELQEGLMRTRTVPLSRSMVPRLRRTIRQVSGELDKPINFEIANNEGELDRSVVERMVAPLEHILRNAIDHGIEPTEQRLAANKPEVGTITLDLKREGGEVVISLTDDGKGIDVDAVRQRAIANGLVGEHDALSNEEIMHFIFSRGFSTASSVTQISGRGIGMDVVQTEIRELGGTISLYSEPGKGTTFMFRLPFTVSMNRALLVTAGGETLAVPIDAVEGVVRVSPYELNEYYGEQAVDFMYAGQRYDFSYLGAFINGSKPSYQSDMIGALPVLLIRTGEKLAALQVDRLLGSREIVVKSLGRQFSGLKSASGATILGDGSVVMIADLSALVRAPSSEHDAVEFSRQKQKSDTTVMVVDDSVTVRKVTSRLLSRNNYEVMVAKDGLDAMALLEDALPDIILLDIEMPNLDGFEVVSRVRHDERLKHIPIVMISSRTGQKHRDRALSLGANDFLGKPYQDTKLLEVVAEYTHVENLATANNGNG